VGFPDLNSIGKMGITAFIARPFLNITWVH